MCIETIEVNGVHSSTDAYEISEFLKGHQHIDDAECDVLTDCVTVDYDEYELDRESLLDEIEYAGCTPLERKSTGTMSRIRDAIGV